MAVKLLIGVLALAGGAVHAAPGAQAASAPSGGGAVAQACAQDVQALCPGVQPGEGRIAACLKGKRKELSKPCKEALLKARRGAGKATGD